MLRHDRQHQTLACASCGAPLRQIKALPVSAPARPAVTHQPRPRKPKAQRVEKRSPTRKRRRESWLWEIAEEAFDFVEDIFD